MTAHMHREIGNLKRKILSVGARIEDTLARAVESLLARDVRTAQAIIDADTEIDRLEVDIEEECLKILALYQPVAADLRFVVAVLKMNNDLERMADLSANIAKRAIVLAGTQRADLPFDVRPMAVKAQSMVRRSLDALVNADAALARQVCADDDELDALRRTNEELVAAWLHAHPEQTEAMMAMSSVCRHLERIGDMATNVCEDVIYMVEGEITRHAGIKRE